MRRRPVTAVSQGGVSGESTTSLGRLTSRTFFPLFAEADARMRLDSAVD